MKRASKTLTVAIIIPAYNEAHRIAACLKAIAKQTEQPNEVILVDNNCTDDTVSIAQKFAFVQIIHEPKQGKIWARDRGFNSAKSDILGRIDADTQIAPNWVATVRKEFSKDSQIVGISGPGYSSVFPRFRKPMTKIWSKLYFVWTAIFFRVPTLWGANMAIRTTAWKKIRHKVCTDDHLVHEDQDISLLLRAHAGKLQYCKDLVMTSYSQAYHYFPKLLTYIVMRHTGRRYHKRLGTFKAMEFEVSRWQSFIMYLIGWPLITMFMLASVLTWPIDYVMKLVGRQTEWLS